jgi:hypothetical protein
VERLASDVNKSRHPKIAGSLRSPAKRSQLVRGAEVRVGWRREAVMIELRDDQLQALDSPQQPPVAVDPRTGQEYLLIRREIYEKVCGFLKPLGRGWDNPADDDLIRADV